MKGRVGCADVKVMYCYCKTGVHTCAITYSIFHGSTGMKVPALGVGFVCIVFYCNIVYISSPIIDSRRTTALGCCVAGGGEGPHHSRREGAHYTGQQGSRIVQWSVPNPRAIAGEAKP
jgi:hypothetical protein